MPYKDPQKQKQHNQLYYLIHREEILERAKEWYRDNIQRKKAYDILYHQENTDKKKEYDQKHYRQNESTYKEKSRLWAEANPEKLKEIQKKGYKKRHLIPKIRLDDSMGSAISLALRGKKAGRKWETLVGYTVEDLIKHLEGKFESWMNWDNYGKYEEDKFKWHVDHIKPKNLFKYEKPEDPEFKECWALENLQPLEARENMRKSNSYIQ